MAHSELLQRLKAAQCLSAEDAKAWASVLLPVPDDEDAEIFINAHILLAIKRREIAPLPASARSTGDRHSPVTSSQAHARQDRNPDHDAALDDEETHYVNRLKTVLQQPQEKRRWHLLAGYFHTADEQGLRGLADRLGVSENAAWDARHKLEYMAVYDLIETPSAEPGEKTPDDKNDFSNHQKEANEKETMTKYSSPSGYDLQPLYHVRERLAVLPPAMAYEDAARIIQCFVDCTDHEKMGRHIERGLKAYDTELWMRNQVINGDHDRRRIRRERKIMQEAITQARGEIETDKIETVRWMVLSVADMCRKNPETLERLAADAGCSVDDALTMVTHIEYAAGEDRIYDSEAIEPVTEKPTLSKAYAENFIGDHKSGPRFGNRGFGPN